MKFKFPKLHNQILIALIAGAIFGSFFNVNRAALIIKFESGNTLKHYYVKNWDQLILVTTEDSLIFSGKSQLEIISVMGSSDVQKIIINNFTDKEGNAVDQYVINNPVSISKEETIGTSIKWIGDIFIRLLNMIAVPLVLASLTVGAASLGNIKKFARIGGKTISFYLVTTVIAIIIGLALANIIQPGNRMDNETKQQLLSVKTEDIASKLKFADDYSFTREIVNLVPRNPFAAIANSEMLQIVIFSLLLGLVLTSINPDKSQPVINFFDGLSEAMIKLVDLVMYIAPIGVFALISATVAEFGYEILQTLFWYALTVVLGLFIHTAGVYLLIIKLFSKMKLPFFIKGIRRTQTIGFSTSSSAATLPVNIESCQEMGVSKSITSFVLPLGATINMDGTALYQGVAAVFIAQVFGMDLTLFQQITIVLTAVLASIGTAPVPGVGIIMLVIILKSVGIPQEGIALILGIDRILDMCRTVTNVTGDAAVTIAIASSEKELSDVVLQES